MNNVCPNCGITGPNFSCPNHTYCWGTGNTQSPIKLMPNMDEEKQWLFAETGRLGFALNKANKEIERLKGLMPPDERGPGFVGQGSWSVFAEKVVAERDQLQGILAYLRSMKVIDGLNRILPLEGHHKDCGHGKDGWSLCTCDELKKVDEERANKQFKDLVEEGQNLRKEFDQKTAGMRGPPRCSKCGDTGLVAYGPNLRGMKHCDCGRLSNGQPTIKTPDGKPLLPPAEFSAMRIEDNKARGFSECHFQRQTGRTTAMVLKALEFVKENAMGGVVIEVHNQRMRKHVKELLLHYADEMGVGHRAHARILTKTPSESISGIDIALQLRDNVFDDTKEK